ncbi:MAG: PRC-barrel domain-containing protein [Akkermansiaceae bacterium]
MLRTAKQLKGLKLRALDGEIGRIHEFLFDDAHWTVRYLVADTGTWLTGRQVLISPSALEPVDAQAGLLPVRLSQAQIEDSPPVSSDEPVSRQHERYFYGYYGWPNYWYGPMAWGASSYPLAHSPGPADAALGSPGAPVDAPAGASGVSAEETGDPHLRSTAAVSGYHIGASDGEIGHVEDFIIDDETWAIRYIVVDTRNWWYGNQVLISPRWIKDIYWAEMKVSVDLTREQIKAAPAYAAGSLDREYEAGLHHHYEREGYWQPVSRDSRSSGRSR